MSVECAWGVRLAVGFLRPLPLGNSIAGYGRSLGCICLLTFVASRVGHDVEDYVDVVQVQRAPWLACRPMIESGRYCSRLDRRREGQWYPIWLVRSALQTKESVIAPKQDILLASKEISSVHRVENRDMMRNCGSLGCIKLFVAPSMAADFSHSE